MTETITARCSREPVVTLLQLAADRSIEGNADPNINSGTEFVIVLHAETALMDRLGRDLTKNRGLEIQGLLTDVMDGNARIVDFVGCNHLIGEQISHIVGSLCCDLSWMC